MIFDTNVVIDLVDGGAPPEFYDTIALLGATNELFVNEIVFAEISGRYASAEEVTELLDGLDLRMAHLSLPDCHRAGVAFAQYRRNGGARSSILPDFLIGAQAAGRGWPIVTRDRKEFTKYFSGVTLIDPMKTGQ